MSSAIRNATMRFPCSIKQFHRGCSSSSNVREEIQRQSDLFTLEQKRQREIIGRVEKIEVECQRGADFVSLVMNKHISTPYDCARHINESVLNKTALALVNGETLWHMHKPLPDSCKLEFLHYNTPQPSNVNKSFWRTCSFILGAIANQAFKDKIEVQLHSFPIPNIKSGSFVYDVQLSLPNWTPKESELRTLSLEMKKFCEQAYPIECLDVSAEFAILMFEDNRNKTQQIPDIASNNGGKVSLFRAGPHVDISKGPMIANTNQLGRTTVTNIIKLNTDIEGSPLYRFQGVALPSSIIMSHFAYGVIEARAKKLNPARLPCSQGVTTEENNFIAQLSN